MTLSILLSVISIVAVIQCVGWWRRRKFAASVVGAVFVVVYLMDMVVIGLEKVIVLTPTIRGGSIASTDWYLAVTLVVATWVVYSLGVALLPHNVLPRRVERLGAVEPTRARAVVAYACMTIFADLGVVDAVVKYGFMETLSLRQQVFGDNITALMGYYLAPVLFVFGILLGQRCKGLTRAFLILLALLNLGTTAITGSRTGLFLTALLPIILLGWRQLGYQQGISRDLRRALILGLAAVIPLVGGSWYLSKTRGVSSASDDSFFNSVDVSQADVLVALVQNAAGKVEGTYMGAIASFVPRDWWPQKPVSGNAVSSMLLAPERYMLTNSEVTAGALGEAYINFGLFAPLSAGLILVIFVWLCNRMLQSRAIEVWLLGVVIVMRGLNLVRGDLANIVTPTLLAVVAWVVLFGISASEAKLGDGHRHAVEAQRG